MHALHVEELRGRSHLCGMRRCFCRCRKRTTTITDIAAWRMGLSRVHAAKSVGSDCLRCLRWRAAVSVVVYDTRDAGAA